MKRRSKGVRHIKGSFKTDRLKIGIIISEFNEFYTQKLLDGALDTLSRLGLQKHFIDVYHTPGSFEIPLVVKRALKKRKYDAIIALGVIIKGQTRHFKQVADAASQGILKASLGYEIPVIHGIVTAQNQGQVRDRVGGKHGHKGREAAQSAVLMANLMKEMRNS